MDRFPKAPVGGVALQRHQVGAHEPRRRRYHTHFAATGALFENPGYLSGTVFAGEGGACSLPEVGGVI